MTTRKSRWVRSASAVAVAAVAVMACGKTKGSTDAQIEKQSPKTVVEAVAASAAPAKLDRSLGAGVTLVPTATVKSPQATQGDQPEHR